MTEDEWADIAVRVPWGEYALTLYAWADWAEEEGFEHSLGLRLLAREGKRPRPPFKLSHPEIWAKISPIYPPWSRSYSEGSWAWLSGYPTLCDHIHNEPMTILRRSWISEYKTPLEAYKAATFAYEEAYTRVRGDILGILETLSLQPPHRGVGEPH